MKNEQNSRKNLYKCPVCKDTGFIIKEVEGSQPIMQRCKCQEIEIAKKIWIKAGINPEQAKQTFSSYKIYNDITKYAKDTAIKYYKDFENIKKDRHNSIAFLGQVGSGKTHLSLALAVNFLEKKRISVVYMPYRDVITSIKQNMLDKEYYAKQLSKYQTAKVLLIDDLYKGKITESDINIMFEIVNYRYLNYLPIIVSSEFTIERLLNFDEAVGSRIYEMCKKYIVQIEGKENNYRLREE
ncbi:chromosomal replication initiator protein DnaA [Clostridium tepidiprofundi DSM 19306]|uniref:Chromosomal replication initiator protein DnaA n=1 Tax=Clostridium tepidiprofundi DSM 19306 TaxID=1121338 RepID=A0A151B7S8_9CLOT|nr:ATP-binding protein [Clostridium tepidiprofundi]KYH35863.1 chromosomal replication initiator protein DnaA [Clostridium tepidiprofundi DSM 19306]